MSSPLQKRLEAAVGYLELGMHDDACHELDGLPPTMKAHPEVIGLRLMIYRAAGRWEDMASLASRMARIAPENPRWWVQWADAARNGQSVAAGREILRRGAALHPGDGHLQFQLGCYSCLLGEKEVALEHVRQAVVAGREWRAVCLQDSDLKAIWPELRAELFQGRDHDAEEDSVETDEDDDDDEDEEVDPDEDGPNLGFGG